MMPPVEVNVEEDDCASGQTSKKKPADIHFFSNLGHIAEFKSLCAAI